CSPPPRQRASQNSYAVIIREICSRHVVPGLCEHVVCAASQKRLPVAMYHASLSDRGPAFPMWATGGSSTVRTRTSLVRRVSWAFSLCSEKKHANDAAYDGSPYE